MWNFKCFVSVPVYIKNEFASSNHDEDWNWFLRFRSIRLVTAGKSCELNTIIVKYSKFGVN